MSWWSHSISKQRRRYEPPTRDPTPRDPAGRGEAEESAEAVGEAAEHCQGRRDPCNLLWKKRGNPPAAWSASRRLEIQPLSPHHQWCKLTSLVEPRRVIWMKKYNMRWWESCQPLLQM